MEQETLDEIDAAFKALDADGSGSLSKDDLVGQSLTPGLTDKAFDASEEDRAKLTNKVLNASRLKRDDTLLIHGNI